MTDDGKKPNWCVLVTLENGSHDDHYRLFMLVSEAAFGAFGGRADCSGFPEREMQLHADLVAEKQADA